MYRLRNVIDICSIVLMELGAQVFACYSAFWFLKAKMFVYKNKALPLQEINAV